MPFPILIRTTLTTVLHYRADCDIVHIASFHDYWPTDKESSPITSYFRRKEKRQ